MTGTNTNTTVGDAQRFNECFMHDEQAVKLGGLYTFDPTHVEGFFSWTLYWKIYFDLQIMTIYALLSKKGFTFSLRDK